MNGVDRYNQQRSTNATERKEKRVNLSLFTFALDTAIHYAFVLHNVKKYGTFESGIREFKRRIAQSLVLPHLQRKERRLSLQNITTEPRKDSCALLSNKEKKNTNCYLCKLMGITSQTTFGCIVCGFGFHVKFFLYYNTDDLK